jgi:hypothetical protein
MAERGELRSDGDLRLVDFRLALGSGRLRLDQQCRDYGAHSGGSCEGVERDLETVGERSAAERGGPNVTEELAASRMTSSSGPPGLPWPSTSSQTGSV